MTKVVNNRLEELEELTEYIANVEKESTMLLQSLNWDKKYLQKKKKMASCPIDDGHRLPESKLEAHLVKCKLQSEGYSKDDILLPDLPVDVNSPSVVKFSSPAEVSSIIHTILNTGFTKGPLPVERPIPQSSGRIQCTYTQDERRAMHDYVASKAHIGSNVDELHMFGVASDSHTGENKSYLERLAETRDSKRRRTKYKKVSTKSKSHTEVLREVIKNQMEVFIEVAQEQIKKEPVEENSEQTPRSDGNCSTRRSRSKDKERNIQKSNRDESYLLKRRKEHRKYEDYYSDESSHSKNRGNKIFDKYCKSVVNDSYKERDQRKYREKSEDKDKKRHKREDYRKDSHSGSTNNSKNRKNRHEDRYRRHSDDNRKDMKRKHHQRETAVQEKDDRRTIEQKKTDGKT